MAGNIEEKMAGNNDKKMALWVDKTEGIIVFNTQKYHKKVHNKNAGDSCQLYNIHFSWKNVCYTSARSEEIQVKKC